MKYALQHFLSDSDATLHVTRLAWRCTARALATLGLCAALFHGADGVVAAESEAKNAAREHQIKAAFLYNFAKFTDWPEIVFRDGSAPLRVCILGHGSFLDGIESIAGKNVHSRQIAISSLGRVDETDACHVVFISETEEQNLPDILDHLSQRPVLTVSDISGFAAAGGMITLKTVDNRIRFTVNLYAMRSGALSLSPQVLRLADIVDPVSTADQKSGPRTTSTIE